MISEQAKRGFDFIVKKALMVNLPLSYDDCCEIEAVHDPMEISGNEFAILTTSSANFRYYTLFHFDHNVTQDHFMRNSDLENGIEKNRMFRDAFLEFCNMCCGFMVRELHKSYHFLGMSTPYVLFKNCSAFISTLNPNHTQHYKVVINQLVILYVTLCVCDYGVVDFEVDTSEVEDDTGELELF